MFSYRKMTKQKSQDTTEENLRKFPNEGCKCSSRMRTLAIGWFNFIICLICFECILWHGMNSTDEHLDRFLYNTADLSPTKVEYIKSVAGFAREEAILRNLEYNQIKNKLAKDGNDRVYDSDILQDPLYDHWNALRPAVILSDIIFNENLLRLVHRVLFVAGGGSIFFLIIIGSIVGIGVIFNGLLLYGAHVDNVTQIAVWIAYQRFIFIFDVGLLILTIGSRTPLLTLLQMLRIIFRLWCTRNVNRHLRSFSWPAEILKTQFYKTQVKLLQPSSNHSSEPISIDVNNLSKIN
ncbi:uncharacterized protein LOC120355691 [Nilaparvata lugens]|uniref:uncharacterized protein LOC120355691 n=1 Tax=Nilaparvata lugens TaxID=108931 RepID=UPI00193CE4AC|nr:uncharacterized protein LOC120355691 [Nilaparvata lugens]